MSAGSATAWAAGPCRPWWAPPSILPNLECRVGLFDIAAMPWLMDAGRRATEAALPGILALLNRAPQLAAA